MQMFAGSSFVLAVLLIGCGGSASETPMPLEPLPHTGPEPASNRGAPTPSSPALAELEDGDDGDEPPEPEETTPASKDEVALEKGESGEAEEGAASDEPKGVDESADAQPAEEDGSSAQPEKAEPKNEQPENVEPASDKKSSD
jgi:hypothetical protein